MAEIQDLPLFTDSTLKGYWRMEDVNDYSPAGLTLTNNGSATFVAGNFSNCVNLVGGSSQYLSASGNNLFTTGSQTWSVWVNLVQPVHSTNSYLAAVGDAGAVVGIRLAESAGANAPYDISATVGGLTGTNQVEAIPSAGVWYHVVMIIDTAGSKRYLYVNNVKKLDASYTGTIDTPATKTFLIGKSTAAAAYLSGKVDDVAIWHRVLSEYEISQLYNAVNPKFIQVVQ